MPVPRKKGTVNLTRDLKAAQIHTTPATKELGEEERRRGEEREEGHSAHIVPLPGLVHQRRLPASAGADAGAGARSVHRRRTLSRE